MLKSQNHCFCNSLASFLKSLASLAVAPVEILNLAIAVSISNTYLAAEEKTAKPQTAKVTLDIAVFNPLDNPIDFWVFLLTFSKDFAYLSCDIFQVLNCLFKSFNSLSNLSNAFVFQSFFNSPRLSSISLLTLLKSFHITLTLFSHTFTKFLNSALACVVFSLNFSSCTQSSFATSTSPVFSAIFFNQVNSFLTLSIWVTLFA